MPTLLVKNIDLLATFDDKRREIEDGAILLRDNVIEAVGTTSELAAVYAADKVLDLSGHIVMPGMVNTHHHMYQNLTRVMVQDDELLVWLKTLYPIWANLDDDAIRVSARVAMAELIHSGCTRTTSTSCPTIARWTRPSSPRARSGCAFTPRGARCRAARARAACLRTAAWRTRTLSFRTPSG
jgi:cytosine/adenosine deaminase-related metal-dependent hydrolase